MGSGSSFMRCWQEMACCGRLARPTACRCRRVQPMCDGTRCDFVFYLSVRLSAGLSSRVPDRTSASRRSVAQHLAVDPVSRPDSLLKSLNSFVARPQMEGARASPAGNPPRGSECQKPVCRWSVGRCCGTPVADTVELVRINVLRLSATSRLVQDSATSIGTLDANQ